VTTFQDRGKIPHWPKGRNDGFMPERHNGSKKKSREGCLLPGFFMRMERRRPTLPRSCPRSTIGAEELNDRVRDGNGCVLLAIATAPNRRSEGGCQRSEKFMLLSDFRHLSSVICFRIGIISRCILILTNCLFKNGQASRPIRIG
jgi:hypothetical protein